MWPFKKREPKAPRPEWIEQLTHDVSHNVAADPSNPYVIQVGIGHYTDKPDRFRVFFRMTQHGWSDLTVIPRQQHMEKHRALVVADAWTKALEVTYDMSLEQMVCDL